MTPKLFMLLLGCKPKGRNTEQHDVFFGIGNNVKELIPSIKESWPEAAGEIHIDAWREVNCVDGFSIKVEEKTAAQNPGSNKKEHDLFFINLGGYKENEFDEFHYKMLVVADSLDAAKTTSKKTAFFKHNSVAKTIHTPTATSHIDDKYGVDVDDLYSVKDILPDGLKEKYCIVITPGENCKDDVYNLGYFKLKDF